MNASTIQKYKGKSVPQLLKKATEVFNKRIRERDLPDGHGRCVSCGTFIVLGNCHASHFYSGGHYSALKFNEDNVWTSCVQCNFFLHGNLNEYRKRLIKKIGTERVEKLDWLVLQYQRTNFKWDRFELIEIIEQYK